MKRSSINIGLVIHGPEIIDSGRIIDVIRVLREIGSLYALVGGTMGRVAAKDSLLEDFVDTSKKMQTSAALNYLSELDVLVLANCGKTNLTGEIFGQIVSSKVSSSVIQVERPGFSDGRVILWAGKDGNKAGAVHDVAACLSEELNLELIIRSKQLIKIDEKGSLTLRRLHGAKVGENILISGIVVGKVIDDNVVIESQYGRLVDIKGARIKQHGYDKIRDIDLKTAYIKSGDLRRGVKRNFSKANAFRSWIEKGKVIFIDHSANSVLDVISKGVICVITIGDDTTNICADILARFGIPVIGITDGDIDGIYEGSSHNRESIIIQVCDASDDDVGIKLLSNDLFGRNEYTLEEVKSIVFNFLKKNEIRFKIRK
jgi:hypothetical protein